MDSEISFFGTTITGILDAFRTQPPATLGGKCLTNRRKAIIQIVVSAAAFVVGSGFILYNQGNSQTVGASMIAATIGYWLK